LAGKSGDQLAKEEARERAEFIEDIFDKVSLPYGTRTNRERAYAIMDLPSLRAVTEQRRRERALLKMGHDELRSVVRENQKIVEQPASIPFTKAEILKMSPSQMRALYTKGGQAVPELLTELNRILAGN
jgi:hypothetical protein